MAACVIKAIGKKSQLEGVNGWTHKFDNDGIRYVMWLNELHQYAATQAQKICPGTYFLHHSFVTNYNRGQYFVYKNAW